MAGEEKTPAGNPWEPVLFIVGFFVLGILLLWQRGALSDIKKTGGLFVAPPPQTAPITVPLTQNQ